ncbi:MAG: DNA polymerase III subunit gamma/tau [Verrucomicrobiota bacterium]
MGQEAYQVIARRWRPRQFDEMVGQEHIVRTLKNAIESDRIAHAYLFVGPRGTGKTTTARIFAKALNAEGGPNVAPDDSTPISQAILNGSCMDVIEIDGASNNGVDQIRDLREECQYSPTEGRFKIYIIDEVHMLSTAAWNALLKTLEEPPAHVKFIFATTEANKVLPTVVSRCQRFEFRPIPDEQIIERLKHIAKTDGINVDEGALTAVARMADGGMRDAQSILDQLISFCGNDITEDKVLDVYGLAAPATIDDMVKAMAAADYQALFGEIETIASQGRDLYRVLQDIQSRTRAALIEAIRSGGHTETLGTPLTAEALTRMLDALQSGESQVRSGLSQRVNFEVSLLRAVDQSRTRAIDSVIKELSSLAAGLPQDAGQKKIGPPLEPKSNGPIPPMGTWVTVVADPEGPIARATGLPTERPAGESHPDGPTEDEWNRSEQSGEVITESDDIVTAARPSKSGEAQLFGPTTPEFTEAEKAIHPETLQMLDELLRADFKYVEAVDPEELN